MDEERLINKPELLSFRKKVIRSASDRIRSIAQPLADSPEISRNVAEAYIQVAYRIQHAGALEEALEVYGLAIPPLLQLTKDDPHSIDHSLRLAFVHNNMGWVLADLRRYGEALEAFDRSTSIRDRR